MFVKKRIPNQIASAAGLFLLILAPWHAGAGQSPADALNPEECDRLYRHQRAVLKQDASHPLAPALRLNEAALGSPSAVAAQKQYCLKNVSRAGFACQLRAKTLRELLDCQQRHAPGSVSRPGPGETKTESPGGSEQIATLTVKVNAGTCERAYRHMLAIYESAPELEELSNKKKLLEYWRSDAARRSFAERCLKQFRSSDLGCILSTSDPDVIQACLLEVPE